MDSFQALNHQSLKHRMDPEIYGGAPLLGVPGAVIITHGSSSYRAIFHAIIAGAAAASNNLAEEIARRIGAMEQVPQGDAPNE